MNNLSDSREITRDRRRAVVPWSLDNLEQLTREQVEFSNRLLSLLPLASFENSAFAQLSEWLRELTGRRYRIELYRLGFHAPGTSPMNLGASFSTWFDLPPDLARGAIVIDQPIMEDVVTGLLEQPYFDGRFPNEVNPYDWGLALYVLMRMVEKLGTLGLPPLMMGTQQLGVGGLKELLNIEKNKLVEVVFMAHSEVRRGLVRLLLPSGMVQVLETYANSVPGRTAWKNFIASGPFSDLPLCLPAELARVEMTLVEIRDLERGDVVFLGEHGLQFEGVEGGKSEHGRLHLSAQKYLPCDVFEGVDGFWNIRLYGDGMRTQEGNMVEDDVSNERTAYLANGALVKVEVRVGQLTLSVGDLARLQSGQVMVLDRDVARGVELVVDGRIVGAGELVSVEGVLGVRVQWMGMR